MEKALVVVHAGVQLPITNNWNQTDKHADAVEDVLREALLTQKHSNVLVAGMWLGEGQRVCCKVPSAAVTFLQSEECEKFHAFVGTEIFRFFFLHCSVIVPLPSTGKLLQLCGPPPQRPCSPHQREPIQRWRIFYNDAFLEHAGIPELQELLSRPNKLCREIFQCPDGERIHPRYRHVRRMIGQAKRVPFGKILRFTTGDQGTLCAHEQVTNFVWGCLQRQFPRGIWVCPQNRRVMHQLIGSFVALRRREQFNLHAVWAPRFVQMVDAYRWLLWCLNSYVIPLIRNHFYVTETAEGAQRLSYFRKPYWKRTFTHRALIEKLHLTDAPKDAPVTSSLRIVPKGGIHSEGMNMRVIARVHDNDKLRIVAKVMRYECPELTFGFSDIFEKLAEYKRKVVVQQGPFYMVKMDVANAYDSINQHALCRLVSGIFKHETYCVRHYRTLNGGKLKCVVNGPVPEGIDVGYVEQVTREHLYALLMRHIRLNIVEFRGRRYRQSVGIPQGSVLSSQLCNLYYSRRLDWKEPPPDSLLMRLVDDTIFITPHKHDAERFEQHMRQTFVSFAEHKTLRSDGLESFPWCGLLIDTHNLEIQWDYARYQGHFADTLTAPFEQTPEALAEKFHQYMRAKRKLLSARLNLLPETILLNFYQACLHAYLKYKLLGGRYFIANIGRTASQELLNQYAFARTFAYHLPTLPEHLMPIVDPELSVHIQVRKTKAHFFF
jgi:hypothetical protein